MAHQVKNRSALQETQEMQVGSPGREDPLEEEWQPTPGFLPEKSQGQRNLMGYSPWGHQGQTRLREWAGMHILAKVNYIKLSAKTEIVITDIKLNKNMTQKKYKQNKSLR